ncbi:MAG: aspartate dehydrogenase [Betaproteobacteria bacterium]|nr:aspartate dehydrogenase [Betaproteobacteria bacterium]MSQ87981.1 aspartate dehydrogenase [Betaproteobacteria bacterium]
MRIGIIGGGVIARLVLEHIRDGALGEVQVVAIVGRSSGSKGKLLAESFGVPFVIGLEALAATRPEAVVEAASHEAVRAYAEPLLTRGISFVALSGGALCDDALRERLEQAAARHRALLYVPSGGIGGLDTLKAVCLAGAEEVGIVVTKPPVAWQGIPYVEKLGLDLDRLTGATVLFEGSAREGVPHFPANVNIAAVLSMAGIGFDRTQLKVVADPALKFNTHYIVIKGRTGRVEIKFESVAMPENPKTSMLACFSALAAIRELGCSTRYGT